MDVQATKEKLEALGSDIKEKRQALKADVVEMQARVAAGTADLTEVAPLIARCRKFHEIFRAWEHAASKFNEYLGLELLSKERTPGDTVH